MAQPIDFNWVLKVKDPAKYLTEGRGTEVKGGYRVFPMSGSIAITSWDLAIVGMIRVTQLVIKRQSDITETDASICGYESLKSLQMYLHAEYPEENHLATFVSFEIVSD